MALKYMDHLILSTCDPKIRISYKRVKLLVLLFNNQIMILLAQDSDQNVNFKYQLFA
ncbi:hypothetical protein [Oryza sativa Japonica Group]|uniref:Uncharacterized protein n=2 Tax=Oryza sativa subsp. japonica TaxID=39947 RepID=Q5JMR3_ORYSJ|nr:hypothetical protein [Oryza sativa Japonica Group]BAD88245.1 hypothetical protein [Oryza sativa Japonica Group]